MKEIQTEFILELTDTLPEKSFDNLTVLAATVCDASTAILFLMDAEKVVIKSSFGFYDHQNFENQDFCKKDITAGKVLLVEDISTDSELKNNELLKKLRAVSYAGIPVINKSGIVMGSLCLFHRERHSYSKQEIQALQYIASQAMILYELKKKNRNLAEEIHRLNNKVEELKSFAGLVSHDMKMPLANMIITVDTLRKILQNNPVEKADEYLQYIKQSALTLSDYISGLLAHYESDKTAAQREEEFDSQELLEEIIELLNIDVDCEINLPDSNIQLKANKMALEQILMNLIGNSLKYNDKEKIIINIGLTEKDDFYEFSISDNGMGISQENIHRIFGLFETAGTLDKDGRKGNGIGLSTVKCLIRKLGGTIEVSSVLKTGSTFTFTIKKQQ